MSLKAILTVGWKGIPPQQLSAKKLHDDAINGKDYEDTLFQLVKDANRPVTIHAFEQLFRRCVGGYSEIKNFVAALISIVTKNNNFGDVKCRVDVFCYAFLKGAKNFDFLLPESKNNLTQEEDKSNLYRQCEKEWAKVIKALEEFERIGKPFPEAKGITKNHYLDLRHIMAKNSARDERRSLATLLVTGPSTMNEISKDLGLNYSLSQRVLGVFVDIEIVEIQDDNKYVISTYKIPLVVFFLRETIGLDYLSSL